MGIPTVLEVHSTHDVDALLRHHVDILQSPYMRTIVVITHALYQAFRKGQCCTDKVVVEPDGVSIEQFAAALDRDTARARVAMMGDGLVCLYAGHLHPHRGIESILDAAKSLPDVRFVFVGGWDRSVLQHRQMANELGVRNVEFVGYVPNAEVPYYLWAADLLLLPHSAHLEIADACSPLKMFEYMASGRPMIATDLPVLREVLQHGENAWLIPPDDTDALTHAIRHLLERPDLANRLGERARNDSQRYSWTSRAERILAHALRESE